MGIDAAGLIDEGVDSSVLEGMTRRHLLGSTNRILRLPKCPFHSGLEDSVCEDDAASCFGVYAASIWKSSPHMD